MKMGQRNPKTRENSASDFQTFDKIFRKRKIYFEIKENCYAMPILQCSCKCIVFFLTNGEEEDFRQEKCTFAE